MTSGSNPRNTLSIRGIGTPSGSVVTFGNIRDGTRCTRIPS